MGYTASSKRVTKADLQREAQSSFDAHQKHCQCCSTWNGKTSTLGQLCHLGVKRYKTVIEMQAA